MTNSKLKKIVDAYYRGGQDFVSRSVDGEAQEAARILREIAKQCDEAAKEVPQS